VLYDNLIVRIVPGYVPPFSTLSDRGVCNGGLEVLNSTAFLPPGLLAAAGAAGNASSTARVAGLAELWCVQYKSQTRYRYFGLAELENRLATRNVSDFVAGSEARLRSVEGVVQNATLGRVESLVISGKGAAVGTGSRLQFTRPHSLQADDASHGSSWQDSLVACPFWSHSASGAGFGRSKLLSVARQQSWAYGTTAMLQKVLVQPPASSSVPLNSSTLLGVFILQKGALIGGSGHAQISAARTDWSEDNVTCDATAAASVLAECSGLSASAWASQVGRSALANTTRRAIMRHVTDGWAIADVTELVQCQLELLESRRAAGGAAATSPQSFELGFLWQHVEPAEDVQFYRFHYPHRATGDALGDADRAFNSSAGGRTEWYTSESGDPPTLVVYWAGAGAAV